MSNMKRGRKKTKLKPREYAGALVAGQLTLDQVPEKLQHFVQWHIHAVSLELTRRELTAMAENA